MSPGCIHGPGDFLTGPDKLRSSCPVMKYHKEGPACGRIPYDPISSEADCGYLVVKDQTGGKMEGDKNGEADCKKAGCRTFYDVCCDYHKLSDGAFYAGRPSDTSGRAGKLL